VTLREQAVRIIDSIDPNTRAHLAADPLNAMTRTGLRVGELEQRAEARRFCDGLSTTTGIVLYMASPGSRRENFTLLHEYAHTRVATDLDAMSWLADQPDIPRATEQLCNEVASLLLVPAEIIDAIVGDGPIRAVHLQQLHRDTEASQVAIAIALARRLTTDGAVMLVDRSSHTVALAILVGELAIFPATGQPVPTAHPLYRIEPGNHIHQRSWWATPWGERQDYYIDATASARRAYAVMATTDLWRMESFHGGDDIPQPQVRPASVRACPCGYNGPMRGFPCPHCGAQFCPDCGKCVCDYRNAVAVRCRKCTLSYAPTALVNGLCSECR
jgi:Zn-dependent peptidase ImmA (M78 family)